MDIFSFNIYSETLFERKKNYLKLVAMKAYLNYFDGRNSGYLYTCMRLNGAKKYIFFR